MKYCLIFFLRSIPSSTPQKLENLECDKSQAIEAEHGNLEADSWFGGMGQQSNVARCNLSESFSASPTRVDGSRGLHTASSRSISYLGREKVATDYKTNQ